MDVIKGFEHQVSSHCETGTTRNLLAWKGLEVSEPMVFGMGSGPAFYYLFFAKGPTTFPLIGIRNRPSAILKNVAKLGGIRVSMVQHRTTDAAMGAADALIDEGIPVAVSVDMFRMKYLPSFMRVHAPFHFIALVGRSGNTYAISDPYHHEIAELSKRDLMAAWETHAPMAMDNLLCEVRDAPKEVDWRPAAVLAIKKTCRTMLLPPVIGKAFFFVGVEGMRTYARKMRKWSTDYRGVRLREGILFNAVWFEDQGTGGAAFRLMYGAFLQEVSALFGSDEAAELAERLIEHGRQWRRWSRRVVVLGRTLPMDDGEYDDWLTEHRRELDDSLEGLAIDFEAFAKVEQQFFSDLRAAAGRLG